MANSPQWYDAYIIAAVNSITANLNNGFLAVYTGAQPALGAALSGTLLATLALSATAFATATASGGTVTAIANAVTTANAVNSGNAGYFALLKSDGTTVVMTGSAGLGSTDMTMPVTAIVAGAPVSVSSLIITEAQV
jgi:acyl-CoA hydrolase